MSSLPPKFWRGQQLPPAAIRTDPILCAVYELQNDDTLSRELRRERLDTIIDFALRARHAVDPTRLPARLRLEIARRALADELDERARIAARGHLDDDNEGPG